MALVAPAPSTWLPLSLVPRATIDALGILAAAVALFWLARAEVSAGGVRFLVRSVAWMGLVAGLVAVFGTLFIHNYKVYGFWDPLNHPAEPVGTMVSRNHFAAWIILALALTTGYLVAHARVHWRSRRARLGHRILSDARAWWLMIAAAVMLGGLFTTQSRGGVIGCAVALAFALILAWQRMGSRGRIGLLAYVVALVLGAAQWARPEVVLGKFSHADSWGGRPGIWRLSYALFTRYWATGTGLGAFDVVMPFYQPAPRLDFINHAHNQYLHFLVEGGVLMAVPMVIAAVAFGIIARRRLRHDHGPLWHVQLGAVAGLLGLAAQSVWETPLLTPAVFFLLAVTAGVAAGSAHSDEAT